MGPVAWIQAVKIKSIHVIDQKTGIIEIEQSADSRSVVDDLVLQYERLFGKAAREVCKDAVTSIVADMQPSEIPNSLR